MPRCMEDYDCAISAVILDPHTQPQLYNTVVKTMLHTCTPERCVDAQTGLCSKGLPKPFCPATRVSSNNQPMLLRLHQRCISCSEAPHVLPLFLALCATRVSIVCWEVEHHQLCICLSEAHDVLQRTLALCAAHVVCALCAENCMRADLCSRSIQAATLSTAGDRMDDRCSGKSGRQTARRGP